MAILKDDSTPLVELTLGDLRAEFGTAAPEPAPNEYELGEPYDGQGLVANFLVSHPIDPNGKWWKRAVAKVPTHILYDDVDKAETDFEMAVLDINADAINATYGGPGLGFITRTVVKHPALGLDGSELPWLACVPNVNVMHGVGKNYAHGKVDEVITRMLKLGWYKDQALEREAKRVADLAAASH